MRKSVILPGVAVAGGLVGLLVRRVYLAHGFEAVDSCGMLLSAIHEEEGEEKLHLLMVDDHIPAGAKLY